MSIFKEHKNSWRIPLLGLALMAVIFGFWTLDLLSVPAQYECTFPNVRLDGDFCGQPLPAGFYIPAMFQNLILSSGNLTTGSILFVDWLRYGLSPSIFLTVLLPLVITVPMIFGLKKKWWRAINIVAWGIAIGFCIFFITSYPRLHWILWGLWLYFVIAVTALFLEIITLRADRQ